MTDTLKLGRTVCTPGAKQIMDERGINAYGLLQRHASGDWGELTEDDKQLNRRAVENGGQVLSSYSERDAQIWVITEGDRSVTTILLPEEY